MLLWVEKEILGYDDNQKLQKKAVLRLKGMANGKVVANNKIENNGCYSPKIIKIAFMINKNKIKDVIKDKDFTGEDNKVAYICAIARNSLNSVYSHVQEAERLQKKKENVDTSIIQNVGLEYQKKELKSNYKKHEELW